ncbi:MAG TPA: hypothetical protein VK400_19155 [Pyrinomonadaceae bacterium]|nr:hypothetical protein [Pyrinomonadaceae bacterium]
MPRPEKIPEKQKERIYRLEKIIEQSASVGNLEKAEIALSDLKPILNRYHHKARLLQSYLVFYEGALESWNLELAKRGFQYVRERASKETRLYLEATVLLAISHLREENLFSAEPLIYEVLNNEHFVPSEKQRQIFIKEVIDRFDQEGAIVALARTYKESISEAVLHKKAVSLLKKGLSEQELEIHLGESVPDQAKSFILKVNQLSRNLLPPNEKLLLPNPRDAMKNHKVGNLVFRGIKRRLYKYLCAEDSEVYQAWLHKGLDAIVSESYVAGAVVAVLTDLKIGVGAIAVGITSLALKQGIYKFCESNKPQSFMSLRKRFNG